MYIAQIFGINSPANTGLIAILGVEVTKKRGIRSSILRITASILALLIGTVLFWFLGFSPLVVGIFVIVVFTVLYRLGNSEGIVTGAVVMFHLIGYKTVDPMAVLNEVEMLFIGLGTATLINIIYMPKTDKMMLAHKQNVEKLFSDIFSKISQHLRDHSFVWDGKELLDAKDEIERGAALAKRLMENSLMTEKDPYWQNYFIMRGEQLESVHRMLGLVAQIYLTLPQGKLLATIFEEISISVKEDYYSGIAEKELHELDRRYKEMPLPMNREEFEQRSAILQLNLELAQYLSVSKKKKIHSRDQLKVSH